MGLWDDAVKIVKKKWAAGGAHTRVFIIPQGPLTVTRPGLFAPNGIYLEDLEFFLMPGQSQDMGALFTQKEINDSLDLKEAILNGQVTYTATGTTPIFDPTNNTNVVSGSTVFVQNSLGTTIDPATEETLQDADNHLANIEALLSGGGGGSQLNVFSSASVPAGGIVTTILTHTVPVGKTDHIGTLVCWGDVDADYQLKVNGTQVGGGRSSIAVPTLVVSYGNGAIPAVAGDVITVTAQQFSGGPHVMKASIAGSEA